MGKKRKVGGRATGDEGTARSEPKASDSKLQINTYEDVPDSEDEFFLNQDRIALEEGPAQKRQRRILENGMVLFAGAQLDGPGLNLEQTNFWSSPTRKYSQHHPAHRLLRKMMTLLKIQRHLAPDLQNL